MLKRMSKAEQNWIIVSCQSDKSDEDSCSWIFFENNALGLEIVDIDPKAIAIRASFKPSDISKEKIDELQYQFQQAELSRVAQTLKVETLANEDWLRNWKIHFEPFTVANFLICPPWHHKNLPAKLTKDHTIIIIDPAMAFGTGLHATTSYCLQVISKGLPGKNILDIGTGSGILAIACALLLPNVRMLAIDIDENAIINAQHNIELNHVQKNIELRQTSPEALLNNTHKFDTILSNLTAEVIIEFLPTYAKLLNKNGTLVLAGIIEERLPLIEKSLSKSPFQIINKSINKGWVGLTLTKT